LAPAPVPPAVFVLDGTRLTYASFRREAGGFALREAQSAAIPPGTFADGALGGPLGNPEALAGAIETLVERLAAVPKRASLVLPDAWLRGLVAELGSLPEKPDLRQEVLRFRLKRLVPFRVEELRVEASPIESISAQEDPIRALIVFAAESVCGALERDFAAQGVRLGQITNGSLARLEALACAGRCETLTALASVERGGFTLVFARAGAPVLWRQKTFTDDLDDGDRAALLGTELRLTRTFLAERLGGQAPGAVYLAAPRAVEAYWTDILADGLERPVLSLAATHLPLAGEIPEAAASDLAALVGGAAREVA
jgi:hypothetical protein